MTRRPILRCKWPQPSFTVYSRVDLAHRSVPVCVCGVFQGLSVATPYFSVSDFTSVKPSCWAGRTLSDGVRRRPGGVAHAAPRHMAPAAPCVNTKHDMSERTALSRMHMSPQPDRWTRSELGCRRQQPKVTFTTSASSCGWWSFSSYRFDSPS